MAWKKREFKLADPLPAERMEQLGLWLRKFAGVSPETGSQLLHDRWKDVSEPVLIRLRDLIVKCEPYSIIFGEEGPFLNVRGELPYGYYRHFYIREPLSEVEVNQMVSEFGLYSHPLFCSFLRAFAGNRDMEPGCAGHFANLDDGHLFSEGYVDAEGMEEWDDAHILYYAADGDVLAIRSDGATAWGELAEWRVVPFADDFEDFLDHYIRCREHYGGIDSYSTPTY